MLTSLPDNLRKMSLMGSQLVSAVKKNEILQVYIIFFIYCPSLQCFVLVLVHVIGLESQKAQSPHQRVLPSPTNTASEVPETPRR